MANLKISQLTSAGALTGTEVLPIVQSGSTVKTTVQDIANLAGLGGTNYVFVTGNGTPVQNGVELLAAYDTAKTMSPSASNIISVVVAPGDYSTNGALTLDTSYINIVSLTGNRDVILDRSDVVDPVTITPSYIITSVAYCLSIQSDYVYIRGIVGKDRNSPSWLDFWGESIFKLPIQVITNLPNIIVENCVGGTFSFGGDYTFGSAPAGIINGTFIDCDTDTNSFGGYNIVAAGTFINCKGRKNSSEPYAQSLFGARGTASGTFINCISGGYSFGDVFDSSCIASGKFINCEAIPNTTESTSFGYNASGYFENCKIVNKGFGTYITTGTFVNCTGRFQCFSGVATGTFTNCTAAGQAWGFFGAFSGKLFFCKLTFTGALFPTVAGAGRTYYCIDGDGNTNNQ